MINERMSAYLYALSGKRSDDLEALEREAQSACVPVIGFEMQSFLQVMLTITRPSRILEVGTATGFSAIFMCENNPVSCQITTIEQNSERSSIARENFKKTGYDGRITLLTGDAMAVLRKLQEPYDLILLDAAKGQYLSYLPDILRLMQPGSLLLSDNVLQGGNLLESRYLITRRNRTIHRRMREYLYTLTHHPQLVTTVLSAGDGITLSMKKENEASDEET